MILVISNSQKKANILADMFRYMGILSIATTPYKALSRMAPVYRAAIIINPEELPDYKDYVDRLQSYSPQTPAFAMTSENQILADGIFDGRISSTAYAASILKQLVDFSSAMRLHPPGDYKNFLINLSPNQPTPIILGKRINLTKTECMVLRYLMQTHPQPAKPEEIISHVYNPSKAPNESNIRTYISVINQKATKALGWKIIRSVPKEGYTISLFPVEQS